MSDLFRGLLPMLILRTVANGELYGYEIARQIRATTGESFARSEGSLYPTLHRLETQGALTATWRASDRGPRRRYYRITPKGLAQLNEYAGQWETVRRAVDGVAEAPA